MRIWNPSLGFFSLDFADSWCPTDYLEEVYQYSYEGIYDSILLFQSSTLLEMSCATLSSIPLSCPLITFFLFFVHGKERFFWVRLLLCMWYDAIMNWWIIPRSFIFSFFFFHTSSWKPLLKLHCSLLPSAAGNYSMIASVSNDTDRQSLGNNSRNSDWDELTCEQWQLVPRGCLTEARQ